MTDEIKKLETTETEEEFAPLTLSENEELAEYLADLLRIVDKIRHTFITERIQATLDKMADNASTMQSVGGILGGPAGQDKADERSDQVQLFNKILAVIKVRNKQAKTISSKVQRLQSQNNILQDLGLI